jgi:hypothetical protein
MWEHVAFPCAFGLLNQGTVTMEQNKKLARKIFTKSWFLMDKEVAEYLVPVYVEERKRDTAKKCELKSHRLHRVGPKL